MTKNLRSHSLEDLQKGIETTSRFDAAIDAIPNTTKTVVFATSLPSRQQIQCCGFKVVLADKLLGCSLSFTKRRSRQLMDQRANAYLNVAKRTAFCPLSIDSRELLLATAGAPKYTYGLELGPCQKKIERTLRSAVAKALWSKGQHKSLDMLFTLCHRGHRIDPVQLKLIYPLKLLRRQLIKHVDLRPAWIHCWHDSSQHRAQFKDGRSNMVGPLCILHTICVFLDWQWLSPFEFSFAIDSQHDIQFSILNIPENYFLHLIRFSINKCLWKRASNARKALRGIHIGIDKDTTIKLLRSKTLNQYDKGILRAILADAISTQHHLYKMRKVAHPVCPFLLDRTRVTRTSFLEV